MRPIAAALALAADAALTTGALSTRCRTSRGAAITNIARYVELGYVVRLQAGRGRVGAVYGVTQAGAARLRRLRQRAREAEPSGVEILLRAFSVATTFCGGATGFG